jgi:CPA1 family monovalent cation:H+ antiporter
MERRFIRRTALRLEEREYDSLLEDGLIGEEVHSALNRDVSMRRDLAEAAPLLDLTLQKAELVRQFPLFSEMEDAVLNRLARSLVTRYVNPGERILRRDTVPRRVFFVASGAVELEVAGQTWRLGRGEMFGQMSLLMRRPQRAEVRAIAPSTLLVLDEAKFLRLLKRSKAIQKAVQESASRRGIPIEKLSTDLQNQD